MSSLQIAAVLVSAVLVFWAVGAHNRLMRLRNAIPVAFTQVDAQLKLRQALLMRQLDACDAGSPEPGEALSALRAALAQLQAAGSHARLRPEAASSISSLRLAEDILLETRARWPASRSCGEVPDDIEPQLVAADLALKFARGRFNEAVLEYNSAVRQFPTWLLARLFGFQEAGNF